MGMFGAPRTLLPPQFAQQGQAQPLTSAAPSPPMLGQGAVAAPPKKPGFNDRGGWAEKLAALSASFGAIRGDPNAGVMLQYLAQKNAPALAEEQYQRRRADEQATWLERQQWQREHPAPVSNDTVNDFDFISRQLGPEAAKKFLETKTTAPPFVQHNADGTLSVFPAGMVPRGAAPSGPAPGTVEGGYRFKGGNAGDPSAWEPVGGASPQGSRTFP